MKTTGKVFGWIIFGIYSLFAVITIGLAIWLMFYSPFGAIVYLVIGLFFAAPLIIWLVAISIKNRTAKFVLYIIYGVLYSPIAGILLAITTHKEKEIEKFKIINKVYPWEIEGNNIIYPKYIYKEFGCSEMFYQRYTGQRGNVKQVQNTQINQEEK